jgi:hypothetical protein
MKNLLQEMGHPQPPTPTQTDNSTALGNVTSNIQPRQTKSMDIDSIVSETMKHRNNSNFPGDPAKLTSATTGPNITAPHITFKSGTAF